MDKEESVQKLIEKKEPYFGSELKKEGNKGGEEIPARLLFTRVNQTGYQGGFPETVERKIEKLASKEDKVLHLFSGSSKVGDIRVDINPESNANCVMDVRDFFETEEARQKWDLVIADPDYNKNQAKKLDRPESLVSTQIWSNQGGITEKFQDFFDSYAKKVLWFDYRVPKIDNFELERAWIFHRWYLGKIRALTLHKSSAFQSKLG